jgi:RNA polymerase sigma factor (sigma-70 family)
MIRIMNMSASNDSELTLRAVAGQRDAFAQIVLRYQSLVCSLAYSATGSLSQSEDIAQETFIAAWKGLGTLREPEKLRPWLCGIARNMIACAVRDRKREPAHAAEPLDTALDLHSQESLPVDHAISREEESILWRSLEHIPQMYREALVLFYREGKSIESVAQQLELSEEAAKQRLSRGRKLLKMEVEAFVESALRQSAPRQQFTSAVLAGLPELPISAAASTAAAAVSKSAVVAKASFIGAMLTPILGSLGGILSMIGIVKLARSAREKSIRIRANMAVLFVFVVMIAAMYRFRDNEQIAFPVFFALFIIVIAICLIAGVLVRRHRQMIQIQERTLQERSGLPFGKPGSQGFMWAMHGGLLGIVFCHPFAILTIYAAKAHDSISLLAILAVLAAALIICRRVFIRKPEQSLKAISVLETVYFVLLLTVYCFRWEIWTGTSPWQLSMNTTYPLAIAFLLFAFFPIVLLIRRNR